MTAIRVTAAHIARGVPDNTAACAIALAVWDAYPDAGWVWIGQNEMSMETGPRGRLTDISLPAEAEKFILAFDRGEPVEPFTFDLDCTGAAA